MKYLLLTFSFCFSFSFVLAQQSHLRVFDNLVNKTWSADGHWENGTPFKQMSSFTYSLDMSAVLVNTSGFTNTDQTTFGPRNHGVRMYDAQANKLKFWEFDLFGGITEGEIAVRGKNILYTYQYGNSLLTDVWEYVNDSTYNFKVGHYDDNEWSDVFLTTQFRMEGPTYKNDSHLHNLEKSILGSWTSKAWDGILNETWVVGADGHLHQSSQYLENGKVLYEARSKIELVDKDLILFTVIKDSDPKIFRATTLSDGEIIFENTEYENPNTVIYRFDNKGGFKRTISGISNGEATSYTFEFRKLEEN